MYLKPAIVYLAIVCGLLLCISSSFAQETAADTNFSIIGGTFIPEKLEFEESLLDRLTLPDGFDATVFAQNIDNARIIAVGQNDTAYVT